MTRVTAFTVAAILGACGEPDGHDHSGRDHSSSHTGVGAPGPLSEAKEKNCAVVCVLAALNTQGIKMSIDQVSECFPVAFRGREALVPMSVVVSTLRRFGVSAEAVQLEPGRLSGKYVPSLLLIHPSSDLAKGHYVLLRAVRDDELESVDPDNTVKSLTVPKASLDKVWKGYAVCFGPSASPGPWETMGRWLLALLSGILAYSLVALNRDVRVSRRHSEAAP